MNSRAVIHRKSLRAVARWLKAPPALQDLISPDRQRRDGLCRYWPCRCARNRICNRAQRKTYTRTYTQRAV